MCLMTFMAEETTYRHTGSALFDRIASGRRILSLLDDPCGDLGS